MKDEMETSSLKFTRRGGPAVADLVLVRHLKDEEVSHGEMEGLAPDRAGHSG